MGSAGNQGAGVAEPEDRLDEEVEDNGNGSFDPGNEFRPVEAPPDEAEREEHPGAFGPGLETGYLRRGHRDHPLQVELGGAPFDPGSETQYDSRRARRRAKKREREERQRREREQKLEGERAEREAEEERERVERERAAREEQARKQRERRRLEGIERARRERAERLRALRESQSGDREDEEEEPRARPTAREEHRRREALAHRLRTEREEREREERERRARIEREREERERAEQEQREARRQERKQRWRRDRDRLEEEKRELELKERRRRAKRARRARRPSPAQGRPRPAAAPGPEPAQAAARPAPTRRARPAAQRRRPAAARPTAAPRRPQPARPAPSRGRARPHGRELLRPTALAGLAVAVVLGVVAGMGALLGLPVPGLSGGSSNSLATAGISLDAGTPAGLPKGPFFPILNDTQPDFGEGPARFGAKRSGHTHEGQDIFAHPGAPEVAVRDGIVLDGAGGKSFYSTGGGNTFVEYSPVDDRSYVYLHMLHPSPLHAGDHVQAGQVIGQLGCTGACDGPHLHFEIRIGRVGYGKEGKAIDPLPFLQQWVRTQAPTG